MSEKITRVINKKFQIKLNLAEFSKINDPQELIKALCSSIPESNKFYDKRERIITSIVNRMMNTKQRIGRKNKQKKEKASISFLEKNIQSGGILFHYKDLTILIVEGNVNKIKSEKDLKINILILEKLGEIGKKTVALHDLGGKYDKEKDQGTDKEKVINMIMRELMEETTGSNKGENLSEKFLNKIREWLKINIETSYLILGTYFLAICDLNDEFFKGSVDINILIKNQEENIKTIDTFGYHEEGKKLFRIIVSVKIDHLIKMIKKYWRKIFPRLANKSVLGKLYSLKSKN